MYTKGLAIQGFPIAVAISLTNAESYRLHKEHSEMENWVLDEISSQVAKTQQFLSEKAPDSTFAKGMTPAPGGVIIFVCLTGDDIEGLMHEDEVAEARILRSITRQCRSIERHSREIEEMSAEDYAALADHLMQS